MQKFTAIDGHFHAVRFYKDDDSLCRMVADFVGEGLGTGQPAIVIATSVHAAGIASALRDRSFDIQRLQASGDLLLLDADEILSQFMVAGMPNEKRFNATLIPQIEKACRGRVDCTIRAYGEMVDVLWKAGQTVAATRLEMLWNKLAATHDFSLVCGYSMGNFYKDAAMQEICSHHSHILSETGEAAPVN